jgi:hypothetical protein
MGVLFFIVKIRTCTKKENKMEFENTRLWMVIHETDFGTSTATMASRTVPKMEDVKEKLGEIFKLVDPDEDNASIGIYEIHMDNVINMDRGIDIAPEGVRIRVLKDTGEFLHRGSETPDELIPFSSKEHTLISLIETAYKKIKDQDLDMFGYSNDDVSFMNEAMDIMLLPRHMLPEAETDMKVILDKLEEERYEEE